MLSRLIGTDRIEQLAGELTTLRADLAAQGRELANLASAADFAALEAGVARLATRVEVAVDEGDALRRAMEALSEQVARLESRVDNHEARDADHDERLRSAGLQMDEVAARAEAQQGEGEAHRLELRKLQMRLDAHFDDMQKTATAIFQQMAAFRTDGRTSDIGPPPS